MTLKSGILAVSPPVAIVLAAFGVLKLLILAYYGALSAPDTMGYQGIADAMQHDPRFWTSVPDWKTAALPFYAFRPIGYPLLLVLTRAWVVTVLIQIAMSVAVAWLMSRIVHDATSSPFLAGAAAVFYLAGETLLWDDSILSDTFYTALFNLVILSLLRARLLNRSPSTTGLLLLGLVWGYSIWIRENGIFLTIIPLGLVLLFKNLHLRRIGRATAFLLPVVCMVGLYTGWNHLRTGQAFVGITGAANYLWPVFNIAKAGRVDPFADDSLLSKTVKHTATDYGYPDQVAVIEKLHDDANLGPLDLQKLGLSKLINTVSTWPLAYAGVVLQSCNPLRIAPTIFDPISALNDFYQLGVPPYERVIPGTGAKSFSSLFRNRDFIGLGLASLSLVTQLLSTVVFLWVIVLVLWEALKSFRSGAGLSRDLTLAIQSLTVFFVVSFSFALIHSEARYLMPVIPVFLIATAIALKLPVSRRFRTVAKLPVENIVGH